MRPSKQNLFLPGNNSHFLVVSGISLKSWGYFWLFLLESINTKLHNEIIKNKEQLAMRLNNILIDLTD